MEPLTSKAVGYHGILINTQSRRLTEEVPELAMELRKLLERIGETQLTENVDKLTIFDRVDHFYGTDFYTAPRINSPCGPNHRTLSLLPGTLHVDVVDGRIVLVETLKRRSSIGE